MNFFLCAGCYSNRESHVSPKSINQTLILKEIHYFIRLRIFYKRAFRIPCEADFAEPDHFEVAKNGVSALGSFVTGIKHL